MFVMDIPYLTQGEKVTITGYIAHKRKFSSHIAVSIKDITGRIVAEISGPCSLKREFFHVGTRIRITGNVSTNDNGAYLLKNVTNVQVLWRPDAELPDIDDEMREQASRMLMSRICRNAAQFLLRNDFIELETRLISSKWIEKGLEPLKVIYPGFGSAATLTTSPAAQVMDFLTTTLSLRAFTVSTSFSTTYRFQNGPADLRVIVAKAMDMNLVTQQELMWNLCQHILSFLDKEYNLLPQNTAPKVVLSGDWPDKIYDVSDGSKPLSRLNLVSYSSNLPVESDNWTTTVETIIQVIDGERSVLLEGARERLGDEQVISSLTLYPSQFLGFLKKAPIRQLRNVGRFNVWKR